MIDRNDESPEHAGGADPAIRRVLIVRPSALGDVCRTVPALVTLRRALPEARIDWLVHEAYVDAVRHHPAVNEVIPFRRKRLSAAWWNPAAAAEGWRFVRSLRRASYDLVVDLQGLLRSGLVTRLTGSPRRVGDADARELAWLGYNRRHTLPAGLHTVDQMLALLAAEEFEPVRDMRLYVDERDDAWVDALLADEVLADSGPPPSREGQGEGEHRRDLAPITGQQANQQETAYACIAPTARWRSKCWPIERYIEVGRRLLETRIAGERIVLLAGPAEREQLAPLLDALDPARVIAPRTTVGQMMALIRRCRLLVCNDSAALHMAVGFDRPIAAVFGPTDPKLVGPYGRDECVVKPDGVEPKELRHRRKPTDQSLIARVTVEEVWGVVEGECASDRRSGQKVQHG